MVSSPSACVRSEFPAPHKKCESKQDPMWLINVASNKPPAPRPERDVKYRTIVQYRSCFPDHPFLYDDRNLRIVTTCIYLSMEQPSSNHSTAKTTSRRLKVSTACDQCRNRKTACDGRRPICRPCERRHGQQSLCVWNPKARGSASASRIVEMERRIAELERTRDPKASPPSDQASGPTNDSDQFSLQERTSPIGSSTNDPLGMASQKCLPSPSFPSFSTRSFSGASFGGNRPRDRSSAF